MPYMMVKSHRDLYHFEHFHIQQTMHCEQVHNLGKETVLLKKGPKKVLGDCVK